MKRKSDRQAFTLIEIMIAVIIIGMLVVISTPRYTRIVEKGRTGEAREILGRIRQAEMSYVLEANYFTSDISALLISAPVVCSPNYYFRYGINNASGTFVVIANRCTAGGKSPDSPVNYVVNLTRDGDFGGTPGFI